MEPLACCRVVEGEACSVEGERTETIPWRLAVEPVAKNRAAECGKMNPELVRAAREGFELDEAKRLLDRG